RADPGIERSEARIARNNPESLLPVETFAADCVPAGPVAAAIFLDVAPRDMMRPMARAEGEGEKEGPLRRRCRVDADIGDGVVQEIGAEMILAARLKADRTIVAVELRIPLIRQRPVESVPAGKAAIERPIPMRARGAVIRDVGQMPFPDGVGGIGVIPKHF